MSKIGQITIIMIATVILMLHSVVPHHHHDQTVVCLSDLHCNDTDGDSHHDDHQGDNQAEQCFITALDIELTHSKSAEINPIFDLQMLTIDQLQVPQNNAVIDLHRRDHSDVSNFYTSYIYGTLGLRAPPIC